MSAIDLSKDWSIVLMQSHPTASLAARELETYLSHISGQQIPVVNMLMPGGSTFYLQYGGESNDGFTWSFDGRNVILNGNNPRGLLYAVYSFLEELGCCWFAPGKRGERIPHGTVFNLPQQPVSETAALPGRCLIIGHHAFMQDVADWIIWAARNRLNTIFFHTTTGSLALGAVPESQYQALKPVFLPLMNERSMTVEHGGHGLTDLLPRELFATLPKAFRFRDGQRTPDHNFCPSSESGLNIIKQNVERHFRAHPEVEIFHLWGDDIPGGGWCDCEACSEYSASDQLLLAVNAVADVLAEINPAAQISFIAYHDTEAVPASVTPRQNVHVLWAPRMRCYAHPVNDPSCRLNVPKYTQTLQDQVEYFKSNGSSPTRVFEYYLDTVLFKSLIPPLPTVIQQDIIFYRDAGVHTMQALMTGDYAWTAPQLNVWLFSRLVWNSDQDLDPLITYFSRAAYGRDLLRYYRSLEQAFSLALDIVPEQLKINVVHGIRQLWEAPPSDMGDPIFAPLNVLEEKIHKNSAIQTYLEAAQRELDATVDTGNPLLPNERDHFWLVKSWLQYDFNRLCLYAAVAAGSRNEISICWRKANHSIKEVYRWGRRCIHSRKHRLNFHFMRFYTWNIRLNKIRADHLCGRFGRRWIELVTKLHLLYLYSRLRHVYDVRNAGS